MSNIAESIQAGPTISKGGTSYAALSKILSETFVAVQVPLRKRGATVDQDGPAGLAFTLATSKL
jgi:hypothetical protein